MFTVSLTRMALRVHVAGWPNCGFYRKTRDAIAGLSLIFPNKIMAEVHECEFPYSETEILMIASCRVLESSI